MEKKSKPPYSEAAQIINQNTGFTDTEKLEATVYAQVFGPEAVYKQLFGPDNELKDNIHNITATTRLKNLEKYVPFIRAHLADPLSSLARAAYEVERTQEIDSDISRQPQGDQILQTLETYMTALVEDPETVREFMRLIKQQGRLSTKKNIENMREAQARGEILETDVIIVGASLNAVPIIKLLSPFLNIKVISNDLPGEPWYSRQLFLNSSSDGSREGKPLPLVGDATPVGGTKGEGPTLAKLDDTSSKIVACDEPEAPYRKYKAGPKVGATIAAQLATGMDLETDFIQGQVLEDQTEVDRNDGLNIVTLRTRDGGLYQYKAGKVIFTTGPGSEEVRLADPNNARVCTKLLDTYKLQIQAIEDRLADEEEKGMTLPEYDLILPTLADFTLLCKYFSIWEEFYDRDPKLYPLREVLKANNEIGIIGNGDTQRILAELFDDTRGPASAYPNEGVSKSDSPNITAYGIAAQTAQEYDEQTRRRYNGALDSGKVIPAPRAETIRLSSGDGIWSVADTTGNIRSHNNIFVATGLSKTPLASKFRNYRIKTIEDEEGIPIGTGDLGYGIFIAGPASRLTASELAPEIQNILQLLGVPENTVAAWVWGPLSERLGLTVLYELSITAYLNELNKKRVSPIIELPGFPKIQQQAA